MNDIKFRAWDGKKMHRLWSSFRVQYSAGGHPHISFYLDGIPKKEELSLQQFTGVLDVKKREIYEGDYVVLEHGRFPESILMKNIFEIVFERGVFALQPCKLDKPDGCLNFSWIKYIMGHKKDGSPIYKYELPGPRPLCEFNICRIIGNKFENPQLIK